MENKKTVSSEGIIPGSSEFRIPVTPGTSSTGSSLFKIPETPATSSTGSSEFKVSAHPSTSKTGSSEFETAAIPGTSSTGTSEFKVPATPRTSSTGSSEFKKPATPGTSSSGSSGFKVKATPSTSSAVQPIRQPKFSYRPFGLCIFFIKDIYKLRIKENYFLIRKIPYQKARICGMITSVKYTHTISITVHDGTKSINCIINPSFFKKHCYKESKNEKDLPPEVQMIKNLTKSVFRQIPTESDLVPGQPLTIIGKLSVYNKKLYLFVDKVKKISMEEYILTIKSSLDAYKLKKC